MLLLFRNDDSAGRCRRIRATTTAILCLFLGTVVVSCEDEDKAPDTVLPQIVLLKAPTALVANANIDTVYTYWVRLTGFAVLPDSVACHVSGPSGSSRAGFGLFDDGNLDSLAGPAYASETSGDIVPRNATYTRRISGRLLADGLTGEYGFEFATHGVTEVRLPSLSVTIQNVEPCLIESFPLLSDFPECFSPRVLEMRVIPSAMDRVDTVRVRLFEGPSERSRADFARAPDDTTLWRLNFGPTFFRCIASARDVYQLSYEAQTRFGMTCVQRVDVTSFVNDLPSLMNSTLPDTGYRATTPGDSNLIVVTVDLQDCELVGERYYYGLEFEVRREDRTVWGRYPDYFLRDDGVAPDTIAGNGTYSSWLVLSYDDSLHNNLYYFRFYAIECAAPYDTSEYLLDSIRVIQPTDTVLASGGPEELLLRTGNLPKLTPNDEAGPLPFRTRE